MDAASNATGDDRRVAEARLDGFRDAWARCACDDLVWVRHASQYESTFEPDALSCCGVRMERKETGNG